MEKEQYQSYTVGELRSLLFELGGAPSNKKKDVLIDEILKISCGQITPTRSNRGRPASRTKRLTEAYVTPTVSATVSDSGSKTVFVSGLFKSNQKGGILITEGYCHTDCDVAVSPKTVQQYRLSYGDFVEGECVNGAKRELVFVKKINGANYDSAKEVSGDKAILPITDRIRFEKASNELKVLQIFCPIAKGQRLVTIAPKNSGKTTLFKDIAYSASLNGETKVMFLLLDQTPEDIAYVKDKTGLAEFISTSFDGDFNKHAEVAETVINRAKVLSEKGDVLLIIESLSRLVKAYRNLYGEDLQTSILRTKKLLSYARRFEGGSLTIIASVDKTLSKEDEAICEELLSVSNAAITLDGSLVQKRIFPALDISGTFCKNQFGLLTEQELTLFDVVNKILSENPDLKERVLRILLKHINDEKLLEKLNEVLLVNCQ